MEIALLDSSENLNVQLVGQDIRIPDNHSFPLLFV